jgi:hypothetical protein
MSYPLRFPDVTPGFFLFYCKLDFPLASVTCTFVFRKRTALFFGIHACKKREGKIFEYFKINVMVVLMYWSVNAPPVSLPAFFGLKLENA